MPAPWSYKGQTYTSLKKLVAAQASPGVTYAGVVARMRDGWALEKAIHEPVGKKTSRQYKVGNQTFKDLKALAKAADISYNAAVKRAHRGWSDAEILHGKAPRQSTHAGAAAPVKVARNAVKVNGIGYDSLSKAHAALKPGCSYRTLLARLKQHWSLEEAFELIKKVDGRTAKASTRRLVIDGNPYTPAEAARHFRVPYNTLLDRLRREASDLQAIGQEKIPSGSLIRQKDLRRVRESLAKKHYLVDGERFDSVAALARKYNLATALVYNRIHINKWTAKKAVTEPPTNPVVVNGAHYRSATCAWEKIGKTTLATYQGRIANGHSLMVSLGLEPLPSLDRYEVAGVKYSTLAEVAAAHSLTLPALNSRLLSMSLEDALTYTPTTGRYSAGVFKKNSALAASPGTLYFVKIRFDGGTLHKIGITQKTTARRLGAFDHQSLFECEGKLIDLYEIEQATVKVFAQCLFRAEEEFEGRTETFLLTDEEERLMLDFITGAQPTTTGLTDLA
ncbi:hypothetical protein [Pseudomonas palleroniana]|uniref:GIY-YIG nuclease family protein n=1 Tax=Pseudomonas palleroniana TaxID=191390 RepID=A0A109FQF7_9PSED|nr:hypothetical protein [Pseudomonas palleroniana]KWU52759.1 hypothetical protein AWV77_02510 [Pseudomonas palleroniana]